MSMKKCPTCGEIDPAKFGKDKHRLDRLATYCKTCRAARHTRTYTPAPSKARKERDNEHKKAKGNAASRNWQKNHSDYVTQYMRQWRKDHREAYNAYHRSYKARATKPQNHK